MPAREENQTVAQLSFDFDPLNPAPAWIEDLIREAAEIDVMAASAGAAELLGVDPFDPMQHITEGSAAKAGTN